MVNFYFPYVNIWKSKRVFTTVLFSSDRSIFARIQIQHHWSSALRTSASCPLGVQQVGRCKWPKVLCSSVLLLSTTVDLFPFTLSGLLGVVPPVIAAPTPIVRRGTTSVLLLPILIIWSCVYPEDSPLHPRPIVGNGTFPGTFPSQDLQRTHCSQPGWTEEQPQESPSAWDTAACVGSKVIRYWDLWNGKKWSTQKSRLNLCLCPPQPYFSGTRSLSPMSSLFGSIWTPQSDPYQRHFQPERSAPVSPITPPHSPFGRELEGRCAPNQFSSFNPFGPHMNLDIWNSASNRSSNSQLSNDSGYCGDV